MSIHTVNDWMEQVAEAMREGDFDKLQRAKRASLDWLQPDSETQAQMALLEAVEDMMIDAEEMA